MKIYFSGINGVGIGPLALMAHDAGYEVCGSDLSEGAFSDELIRRGCEISIGQSGSEIAVAHEVGTIDWFVMTAALPREHPELMYAREHDIRVSKRDGLINHILEDKSLKLLAISGTHGKTTTTAMMIWLFRWFDIPLSYSVGTTLSFGPSARYEQRSQFFAYEADEFDRNFLKFNPFSSIVTTIDFDHPDTYADQEAYDQAFADFIEATEGATFAYQHDIDRLPAHALDEAVGLDEHDDNLAHITLPGEHNRHNALLTMSQFYSLFPELEQEDILGAINEFPGSHRRFEKIQDNLYSDYAHHPSEITAMIQMAHELSNEVVIIYQPHQNKRQLEIMESGGYGECFDGATKVFWLPTYLSREGEEEILSPEKLIASTHDQTIFQTADMNESLKTHIKNAIQNSSLVIAMSAGSLDSWIRDEFISEDSDT